MPVRRVTSIVLRHYRVGEADKIVVFFSLELGKLRGIARSARRARSRFGGSLEIGTEVELTFFEKEIRDLVTVDRCDIICSKFAKLTEPVLASTLGYVTDLIDAFAPEREPNPRIYRLLQATVASIAEGRDPELQARYFEAWLLRLGGFYPRQKLCAGCGRKLVEVGANCHIEEQRFECRDCLRSGTPVSADTLACLDHFWKNRPEALPVTPNRRVSRELSQLHYKLIQEQLDRELKSRQILEDMLRMERGE